jgi:hypothetical protein
MIRVALVDDHATVDDAVLKAKGAGRVKLTR